MSKLDQLLGRITALAPADRHWLLQNTPAHTRAQLLAALGSSSSVQRASLSDSEVVANASPDAVAHVLHAEPPWMVAVVFKLEAWPWAKAAREMLPVLYRPYMVDDRPPLAGGVRDALLKSLAAKLSESTVDAPSVASPTSFWQRLFSWEWRQ
jgi:hypothetical protein